MHLSILALAALIPSSGLPAAQVGDKTSIAEVAAVPEPAVSQAKEFVVLPWAEEERLAELSGRHGELRRERARQGGWMRAIDQIHHDEPGDGSHWVRGRTYKAQASSAGLTFVPFLGSEAPRNWPLSLQLVAASVGELDLPLESCARVTRDGHTLALDHGALREELRCTLEAVEQVFVIEQLPSRGELELTLTVESDLAGEIDGDGLLFRGPHGSVRYGGVTVFDAAGRSIQMPSRIEHGRIVLRVPATFVESAELPLVVDPLIWMLGVEADSVYAFGPDVAWDSGTSQYLVTWEEAFSASDSDVNSGFFSAFGNVGTSAYIDVSTEAWRAPGVANNALSSSFLVVAQVNLIDIRGRLRYAWDGMGSKFQISPSSAFVKWAPAVGGDASATGPTYFLVVWEEVFQSGSDHDIYGKLVSGNGTLAGSTITLDNGGGTYDGYPRVSKTNGHPPFDQQGWNITWGRNPDAALKVETLLFMQIRWDGQVLIPKTVKVLGGKTSIFDHCVSPPLDGPVGAERMFVLLHATDFGSGPRLISELRKGQGWWTSQNLGADFGSTFGQGTIFSPTIDTDGAALVVGFAHTDTAGGTVTRVGSARPSSLNSSWPFLQVSEAPIGLQFFFAPSSRQGLSLQHGATTTGPMAFCAFEQAGNLAGAVYEIRDRVIGSPECTGNPTSTGSSAHLSIVGSRTVSENRVYLEVWDLPTSNVGIFIMSQNVASIPFGQGVLCLGSPLYRFQQEPKNSGGQGFVSLKVNLNSPAGAPPIVPGQTWRFQYWTRDGSQVNFSSSARVNFQ